MRTVALLLLFLSLAFAMREDDASFTGAEEIEQNDETLDETPVDGYLLERSDHRCGGSRKEFTATLKGTGACAGADENGTGAHQHLNAASPEQCVEKCMNKYPGKVTWVEYHAGSKYCDCQKGSSCTLMPSCSTCSGFKAYRAGTKAATCGGNRCCSKWGWCGGDKTRRTATNGKTGVCRSADSKRYTGINSANDCASKCGTAYNSNYVEYASSLKTCDCDKSAAGQCSINKSHSYHRKFKTYKVKKDAWCGNPIFGGTFNHIWGFAARSEDVSVTLTTAFAGLVALAGFGGFKLFSRTQASSAEYESLLNQV